MPPASASRATSRARTSRTTRPTSSSATPCSATSSSSSSRACRASSSTCGGPSSRGPGAAGSAYLLMRPSVARIRTIFDYEKVGGSPLLGVKGTAIITHGRAKRRMIGYACEVAATTARTRVPELIAETLAADRSDRASQRPRRRQRPGARHPRIELQGRGGHVSGPELTVGQGVIAELVRLAAFEVPGVARVGHGGPLWRRWLAGPPVRVRVRDDRVVVRLRIVARPGQALGPLDRAGPVRGRRDRRAVARTGPRRRDGRRRWCRRLIASADDGRDVDSRWPPSSKPTSASARPTPSSSATSRSPSVTRPPRPWRASWSKPSSPTGTRSTPRSGASRRSTRSPVSPRWTARCSERPSVRCYTPPRRPGWPSPSGSSWHAPTAESRCGA